MNPATVNPATVDELVRDASRGVRSIMWDVTALDGPGLAAAWPAFAGHARDALAAVPLPDPATRLLIHRVEGPRPRPNRWGPPVDAVPDPHLVRAGEALAGVAELLTRYAVPPTSSGARRDADLVCRGVAECLLVGSHATALGLGEHAARLQPARAGVAFERPDTRIVVNGARQAQSRRLASNLATLEAHVAHYLARAPGPESEPRGRPDPRSRSTSSIPTGCPRPWPSGRSPHCGCCTPSRLRFATWPVSPTPSKPCWCTPWSSSMPPPGQRSSTPATSTAKSDRGWRTPKPHGVTSPRAGLRR